MASRAKEEQREQQQQLQQQRKSKSLFARVRRSLGGNVVPSMLTAAFIVAGAVLFIKYINYHLQRSSPDFAVVTDPTGEFAQPVSAINDDDKDNAVRNGPSVRVA